jgi:hypothetical protein
MSLHFLRIKARLSEVHDHDQLTGGDDNTHGESERLDSVGGDDSTPRGNEGSASGGDPGTPRPDPPLQRIRKHINKEFEFPVALLPMNRLSRYLDKQNNFLAASRRTDGEFPSGILRLVF